MPILPAPQYEENRALRQLGIDAYPASTSDVLGATAEDAWSLNPTNVLGRAVRRGPEFDLESVGAEFGVETMGNPRPRPTLSKDEANEKWGIKGELSFEADTPEEIARELYELKRAELRRKNVLSRGQGGFVETAGQFAVGLGVSALDPLNIASAFIPVVAPARYAIWASRFGTTGARALKGGVEGFTGAAAVEPIVLAGARYEQADYDATDSMLNLAFGTVLGGGLHVGLGKVGDLIGRLPMKQREEGFRAAVAEFAETGQVSRAEATLQGRLKASVGREVSDAFDALLPDELRFAAPEPEMRGVPERLTQGPPREPFSLDQQLKAVREQRSANQAEFDRIKAERDRIAAAEPDKSEAERLDAVLKQADERLKAAKAERKALSTEGKKLDGEVERLRGKLSTMRDGGVSGSKVDRVARQLERAQEAAEAHRLKIADADSRIDDLQFTHAEAKTQKENFVENAKRRRETALGPADEALGNAKSRLEASILAQQGAEGALAKARQAGFDTIDAYRTAERERIMEEIRRSVSASVRSAATATGHSPDDLTLSRSFDEATAQEPKPQADRLTESTEEVTADLQRLKAAGVDIEADPALKAASELEKQAKEMGKAVEAAAFCLRRKT
jgi:hypothetical protein